MKISENGLNLIKKYEGLSLTPYRCHAGKSTIGYGSTYYPNSKRVSMSDEAITEQQANEMLEFIANKDFGSNILKMVKVPLNQNQFDALVCFSYNVGNGNFNKSTLLKLLNNGDYLGASNEFLKWDKSGGVPLKGLTLRRQEEKALFNKNMI